MSTPTTKLDAAPFDRAAPSRPSREAIWPVVFPAIAVALVLLEAAHRNRLSLPDAELAARLFHLGWGMVHAWAWVVGGVVGLGVMARASAPARVDRLELGNVAVLRRGAMVLGEAYATALGPLVAAMPPVAMVITLAVFGWHTPTAAVVSCLATLALGLSVGLWLGAQRARQGLGVLAALVTLASLGLLGALALDPLGRLVTTSLRIGMRGAMWWCDLDHAPTVRVGVRRAMALGPVVLSLGLSAPLLAGALGGLTLDRSSVVRVRRWATVVASVPFVVAGALLPRVTPWPIVRASLSCAVLVAFGVAALLAMLVFADAPSVPSRRTLARTKPWRDLGAATPATGRRLGALLAVIVLGLVAWQGRRLADQVAPAATFTTAAPWCVAAVVAVWIAFVQSLLRLGARWGSGAARSLVVSTFAALVLLPKLVSDFFPEGAARRWISALSPVKALAEVAHFLHDDRSVPALRRLGRAGLGASLDPLFVLGALVLVTLALHGVSIALERRRHATD